MQLSSIHDLQRPATQGVFATLLLDGQQSNVRLIRLAPGQALPPHRHGASDLMLYATSGTGELETPEGGRPFAAGALAFYRGDEELRVRNTGPDELVLLAFLAPRFPPASSQD
jgi:quercetin dioxygenase-like cupin family protein